MFTRALPIPKYYLPSQGSLRAVSIPIFTCHNDQQGNRAVKIPYLACQYLLEAIRLFQYFISPATMLRG
jgi:hypothetical protein